MLTCALAARVCVASSGRRWHQVRWKSLLLGDSSKVLNNDDSFLEKGIIDSTGVLELVSFVEETFNFRVEDEELIPDNLDSVNKLEAYIQTKLTAKTA